MNQISDSTIHHQLEPVLNDIPPASILLIEDTRSDVVLLTNILRYISRAQESQVRPLRVTDFARLGDALELLDHANFDVVLLDLNLLDSDGVASVAAIHTHVPHIPIIVYSGMPDYALKEKALLCGAQHFLVKGRDSTFTLQYIIEQSLSQRAA